jgi:membrane fusion protein, multidrug efflux system
MRRIRRATAIVAVMTLVACGGGVGAPRDDSSPIPVRTLRLVPQRAEIAITATGAVEPQARVSVAAQEEGIVTAVRVREGDHVQAGEVLVTLDDREIRAALAEAEAVRVEAEAQWKRMQSLLAEGLAPAAQADSARASFETAAARADALRTRLSFTRIAAPVEGVVTARHVEVGDLAAARSALIELAAGDGLILRVPVSELEVVKLSPGDAAQVTVDALPETRIRAHISRIFPAAAGGSRQVTVELALENVPAAVRPGFLARARLVVRRIPAALLVPEAAVLRGAEVPFFVYVVADGVAAVRPVKVGARLDGRALLSSGVRAGDEVVVEGMGRLQEGAKVTVRAPEPAS